MSRTVISDLNSKEIIRNFYEKALQKENLNQFTVKKVIKTKGDDHMLNGKATIIILTV